jgi:hypothetical protein
MPIGMTTLPLNDEILGEFGWFAFHFMPSSSEEWKGELVDCLSH